MSNAAEIKNPAPAFSHRFNSALRAEEIKRQIWKPASDRVARPIKVKIIKMGSRCKA
jgi:hypothetical protein